MTEPHELTHDEMQELFLNHVWTMIHYWNNEARAPTSMDKLTGLAHSLLAAVSGCAAALPAFALVPLPHPTDKAYHQENEDNWWPDPPADIGNHDIGDSLHQ